jgi:hypothetical protein
MALTKKNDWPRDTTAKHAFGVPQRVWIEWTYQSRRVGRAVSAIIHHFDVAKWSNLTAKAHPTEDQQHKLL